MGSLTKASISGSPQSSAAGRRLFSVSPAVALAIVGMLILGAASASAQDNGHAFSFEIKPTGTAEFTGFEFCCPRESARRTSSRSRSTTPRARRPGTST